MKIVIALLAGIIFGLGLLLSGMSNPAKVLGFLDLAGNWDPSLAAVMLGAIVVAAAGFALARRRLQSLSGQLIQLPSTRPLQWQLAAGGVLFGIGWGIAGICPGPALVLIGQGYAAALAFGAAMLAGIWLHDLGRGQAHP